MQGKFVSSLPGIYSIIDFYQYGLMDDYSLLKTYIRNTEAILTLVVNFRMRLFSTFIF